MRLLPRRGEPGRLVRLPLRGKPAQRAIGAPQDAKSSERGPRASWVSVPDTRLHKITVPVLLVHHWRDGCGGSTFETASTYPPLFRASPRVGFIEVDGGATPLSDDPCRGKTYHTFHGQRSQVIEAVIKWINGEDIRRVD